jgi:hypothetical protein
MEGAFAAGPDPYAPPRVPVEPIVSGESTRRLAADAVEIPEGARLPLCCAKCGTLPRVRPIRHAFSQIRHGFVVAAGLAYLVTRIRLRSSLPLLDAGQDAALMIALMELAALLTLRRVHVDVPLCQSCEQPFRRGIACGWALAAVLVVGFPALVSAPGLASGALLGATVLGVSWSLGRLCERCAFTPELRHPGAGLALRSVHPAAVEAYCRPPGLLHHSQRE